MAPRHPVEGVEALVSSFLGNAIGGCYAFLKVALTKVKKRHPPLRSSLRVFDATLWRQTPSSYLSSCFAGTPILLYNQRSSELQPIKNKGHLLITLQI
jgi:hypothetical protein